MIEPCLPFIFAGLMGLAVFIYVVLDGYDLGVGILMYKAKPEDQDMMLASIGPFWDANETWLVLSVGLLLTAFPLADGIILGKLYLPTAFMLYGLIVRGVAYDFRAKAKEKHKDIWNKGFILGSLFASWTQGYMLGSYIMGFRDGALVFMFNALVGVCLATGYAFIGAAWLIMKTEGELQKLSVAWAKKTFYGMILGTILVSIATPAINIHIFARWFAGYNLAFLAPVPILAGVIAYMMKSTLDKMPMENDRLCWAPFVYGILYFLVCFIGLAYSFYPYLIQGKLTIEEGAGCTDTLRMLFLGASIVVPIILAYTLFSYRVFWGKVERLSYY